MEINVEDLNPELKAARARGEELAEFIALFTYFLNHTPEGRAVSQEIERDWAETVTRLRGEKRLIGADFICAEWLRQIQKELLSDKKPVKPAKKTKPKVTRAPKKKVLRFKGIQT